MKKTRILILFLCSLTLVACQHKDYTCHCDGGMLGGAKFTVNAGSLRQAKKACSQYNSPDGGAADGYFNCRIE
jgi:hypothetical protein